MDTKLHPLLSDLIGSRKLTQAVISQPKRRSPDGFTKVKIKPVQLKAGLQLQFEYHYAQKVTHENVAPEAAADKMTELLLEQGFKQGLVQTKEADYHILVNKKGEASVLRKNPTRAAAEIDVSHNRKKRYLLEEGTPVPFLVELGVMNAQGKVLAAKYDKFRQINRYLEMVDDVVDALRTEEAGGRPLHIVDFGCGKSYLTFALYHYLRHIRELDVRIVGLDLKADVIAHCKQLAEKLGYGERLQFLVGDIAQYDGTGRVDMVVTLHACDTATDAALEKAVRWGADVILSVPCCQHELFAQLRGAALAPMLGHGIIRERFAALATDTIRASLLELLGYKTQILEFIDLEHTPKNLLIRAVRLQQQPQEAVAATAAKAEAYRRFVDELHASPYLERALQDKLTPILGAGAAR
ncbi:class I SAM-dependent methyltransferase [Paenibacillus koleovorans]|uniref:class I SAM-dependent methyltransferase n=1 Tax=Paenibacillus koleovorans TaxID=121608 RepID=UPI000FDB967D|nr:SAM-dependent methyltransferase [Paenibacillus koleovorans]